MDRLVWSALGAAACTANTAPGNDREAGLDPPAPAAETASASEATSGVATELLIPQIMTDADVGSIPGSGDRCLFRMTKVDFPVLVYGSGSGVIKLNGKLIPLLAMGDGRYGEAGVDVTVRPLEEATGGELFPAELVLRFRGAPQELGFHGFAEC